MGFELQLEKSLILELDLSFSMLIRPPAAKLAKYLYIGSDWTEKVEPELLNEAKNLQNNSFAEFSKIFAWKSPYKDDLQQHIDWLKGLTVSEMYHLLSPLIGEANSFPFDIENHRNNYVLTLEKWYKRNFKFIENDYAEKFKKNFEEIESILYGMDDVDEFLEEVTGGLIIDPSADIKTVVLFPHFHYRPFFTSCICSNIIFASYSPQFENERYSDLEWLTNFGKAISDENRVKMIKILSQRKVTFTGLTKELGSTKANVYHHLLILRLAKLIRMYETGDKHTYGYYSLRSNILETATAKLSELFI